MRVCCEILYRFSIQKTIVWNKSRDRRVCLLDNENGRKKTSKTKILRKKFIYRVELQKPIFGGCLGTGGAY